MGCSYTLSGKIKMSRWACEVLKESTIGFPDDPIPVVEYVKIEYLDGQGQVYLFRQGTECWDEWLDEELVALIARLKDRPGIDFLDCKGKDLEDFGRFYIDCGRWCYVGAEIPPVPPGDDPRWQKV
ncbi:hypothetical protein SAMN00808754_1650 [Thermanaeromonas toyohensis ToBE]|uniref:Uncharacterized protein n=1 Tax=Thermanaeromonas toyohensis ToBE TaxID=698762 RepID=A0A1W1VTY0_9FIRM|nr:hypothetical protein [Thermanaeromonas toyohensis]SMB96786.1 hypothetical protein SAMN00808754_1650 [Thermanaeromonas toyohensis ToBE]